MKMDWERKFNSILKDTEANLSRVKNKFTPGSTNVTWAPKSYSTPMKKSSSLLDIPMYSTPRPNFPQNGFPTNGFQSGADMMPSFTPYPSTQALQEKIEQQSLAIDHLTGLVHRLETDRYNYKEQIRDLRNEIFQLNEKAGSRLPDPSTERRVEAIRRELLGEIQLLQSQLQISSAKGSNSQMSDTQIMSMNRDFLEIKHAYRDELENFRRDMEIVRSRIAKVELELANVLSERRHVERRQDHLDRTLNSLSLTQQKAHIPSSTVATMMNTNRQLDQLQISELRRTLDALKDKIDNVEHSQFLVSSTPLPTSPKKTTSHNGHSPIQAKRPSLNDTLEDLDLSDNDSESSDFTEFDVMADKKQTIKEDKDELDVDEDELNIDDLDLSDDDLSSLDEPLDKAIFS